MSTLQIHKKTGVALFVFTVLFALLFQYRFLSLLKRLGANITPIGNKFPIVLDFQNAPQWLVPFYYTLDYLNAVWFTTVLGLLIAGAVVAFVAGLAHSRLKENGLRLHFAGVLLGLPNMLCTCCATSVLTGLRKAGAGLGLSLAFFIAAPALNIVVILLAFELLPLKLAVARTLLGLVAAVGVTYTVAKLFPGVVAEEIEPTPGGRGEESITDMLRRWLNHVWDITKVVIPTLFLGIFIISLFRTVLPFDMVAKHLGDGLLPTLLASIVGTILMVPTFTEVLWVGELTRQGMGMGPAVALLITLPAVSFPSLWVLAKVFRSYRVAVFLGIFILVLGLVSGTAFAMIFGK